MMLYVILGCRFKGLITTDDTEHADVTLIFLNILLQISAMSACYVSSVV
jgi:hypothetical protein